MAFSYNEMIVRAQCSARNWLNMRINENSSQVMIEFNGKPFMWNRDARDLDGLSDRELIEELCRRVVDYHAASLKFHDGERGTPAELIENDNNCCRVREMVKHVLDIDLEDVEDINV